MNFVRLWTTTLRAMSPGTRSSTWAKLGAFVLLMSALRLPAQAVPCTVQNVTPHDFAAALQETEKYLHCLQAATKTPGLAMAVVYKDEVRLLKGYGVRKAGETGMVDQDTIFLMASVSKPMSSTVVASLVGSGEVNWTDRIATLDPEFALSDAKVTEQLTIRDLLSHESGLPGHAGDSVEELGYTRHEVLKRLRDVPLTGTFRKTYAYTNFGFTEGALAASLRVGQRWEDLANDRLFSRLKMTRSSYRYTDYENAQNRAAPHIFEKGVPLARYMRDADAQAPAGGLSSSIKDLAQWLRLQLAGGRWNNEQVVDAKALEATHEPLICTAPNKQGACDKSGYYGLGWSISTDIADKKTLSHSGAFFLGASTTVRLIPEDGIGIVVLSNTQPVGVPEMISLTFLDLFEQGKPRMDWYTVIHKVFATMTDEAQFSSPNYSDLQRPASTVAAQPLTTYVGQYANPYYGTAQVTLEQGALVLRLPPVANHFDLRQWDGSTFTYFVAGESSGIGRRGVKFLSAGSTMLIENLVGKDDNGVVYQDGVFKKVAVATH